MGIAPGWRQPAGRTRPDRMLGFAGSLAASLIATSRSRVSCPGEPVYGTSACQASEQLQCLLCENRRRVAGQLAVPGYCFHDLVTSVGIAENRYCRRHSLAPRSCDTSAGHPSVLVYYSTSTCTGIQRGSSCYATRLLHQEAGEVGSPTSRYEPNRIVQLQILQRD